MNYSIIRENPQLLDGFKGKDLVELTCSCCDVTYSSSKTQIKGKISQGRKNNYCSLVCSYEKKEEKYKVVPCSQCGVMLSRLISSIVSEHVFCNHTCSAKYTNVARGKAPVLSKTKSTRPENTFFCKECDCKLQGNNKHFCSIPCNLEFKAKEREQKVIDGLASSNCVKNYLIKLKGCICSKCNLNLWNSLPIPIELEHIDGNSDNNALINCCLLCPNCHAQTPTYKAKNIGNGRHFRRLRYQEGKSY